MTNAIPPEEAATGASSDLAHLLSDPDHPDRPRLWTPRQPLDPLLRRRISRLCQRLHQPHELVTVNLSTDQIEITPL